MIKNDMLVQLMKLAPIAPELESMHKAGIVIRRANPWEITLIRDFIVEEFTQGWADEVSIGYTRQPISVYIAIAKDKVIGFAAYECTRRAYFGPTGVAKKERGKGIGRALLLAALHGLKEMGYAYGIIGSAETPEFYTRTVGAIEIENSAPGVYVDLIGVVGSGQD